MSTKGRLLVVSGPSGVGKTTLLKMLLDKYKDRITFSVSYTSRLPRSGEVNTVDYIFVSKDEFEEGIQNNIFLEYAIVHGNYYGTSKQQVADVVNLGKDCLLDIDVQGGLALMSRKTDAVYIFIAPPSLETLRDRLTKRSTDSIEVIEKRLKNASDELAQKDKYQYIIFNDNLDNAFKRLEEILYIKN